MIIIRKALPEDLPECNAIYERARAFMKSTGNGDQWGDTHPCADLIAEDVSRGLCHVVEEDKEILGVFYFNCEDDPTYRKIYQGEWLSDSPYAVIHRVAVKEQGRGVVKAIFSYCYSVYPHLRIDTHENNAPMLRALEKNGFKRCGIIYIASGDARIAFEKL